MLEASGIDAVVIDADMFDGDASLTVTAVLALEPAAAVLVLTTRVDEALLEALANERVSCISAYSEARAIVSALGPLLAGQTLLPPQVQRALTQLIRRPPSPPDPPPLTAREAQVLELAATGLTSLWQHRGEPAHQPQHGQNPLVADLRNNATRRIVRLPWRSPPPADCSERAPRRRDRGCAGGHAYKNHCVPPVFSYRAGKAWYRPGIQRGRRRRFGLAEHWTLSGRP